MAEGRDQKTRNEKNMEFHRKKVGSGEFDTEHYRNSEINCYSSCLWDLREKKNSPEASRSAESRYNK